VITSKPIRATLGYFGTERTYNHSLKSVTIDSSSQKRKAGPDSTKDLTSKANRSIKTTAGMEV